MVDWHLLPNESSIHETKISRMVFWNYYFIAIAVLILSAVINLTDYSMYNIVVPKLQISGGLIVVAAALAFIAERFTSREMVLLTTERILIRKRGLNDDELEDTGVKKGVSSVLGSVRMEALKLETITNVQVRQTVGQRIFGMGDLAILAGNEEHVVKDLHHPFDIEKAIYRIIEKRGESATKRQSRD